MSRPKRSSKVKINYDELTKVLREAFENVEDALYANQPHLDQLLDHGRQFIIGVKPTKNAALFKQLEGRQKRGDAKELILTKEGSTHHFYWTNNVPVNNNGNLRVNFLNYEEHTKGKEEHTKGKIKWRCGLLVLKSWV